jgi:hypothetical protein
VANHTDVGIAVNNPSVVIGNLFRDQGGAGIDIGNTADDSEVLENVLWNNAIGITTGTSADRIRIWHNTVHASTGAGVVVGGADTDLRNKPQRERTRSAADVENDVTRSHQRLGNGDLSLEGRGVRNRLSRVFLGSIVPKGGIGDHGHSFVSRCRC